VSVEKTESVSRIGIQVRALIDRFHRGSIRAAATDLGMPVTTLFQIVRNQRQPRLDSVRRLAAYYRVSLDWLLTGKGPGPDYGADVRHALGMGERAIEWISGRDNAPPDERFFLASVLPAGWLAWNHLLERVGLTGETLAIWNSLPVVPLIYAIQNVMSQAPQLIEPSPLREELSRGLDEATDASCRAWHTYVSALLRILGPDAMRSAMEHANGDALLGFNPTAMRLSHRSLTPEEFMSRVERVQTLSATESTPTGDVDPAAWRPYLDPESRSSRAKSETTRRAAAATRPTTGPRSRKRR
jgi:transcriptional regulator with XRE-family HTH domain